MSILVKEITTALDEPPAAAIEKARRLLGVSADDLCHSCIAKTSLDARKRDNVHFVHTVSFSLVGDEAVAAAASGDRRVVFQPQQQLVLPNGTAKLEHRPVIAGFGPAGIFAGLLLARGGYRPLILERGASIERRAALVEEFWQGKELDTETNVQFGEGGAGAFSDGKLTTRIGDEKCAWVLQELVRFGAPEEILHQAKPHVGTDRLREVVRALREEILRLGGEVRFETPLTGMVAEGGRLRGVVTSDGEIPTKLLILAVGHSARETFALLEQSGIAMQPKPFSVGVRVEHLQSEIDHGLYGALAGHPALPTGEYQLSWRDGQRGVYTFCMCPGGVVVPAASQREMLVTNGMSFHARDGRNANAALVVSVTPDDYGHRPLDGLRFQQQLEQAAFAAGGGRYAAPVQDAGHFLCGQRGFTPGRVLPSYANGVTEADFNSLFPAFITKMLREGLRRFDRRLPGFAAPDTVLTGIETRTSSPVRLLRREDCQSAELLGLYPCAEGAGYAGGIMSAAVDGLRVALSIMAEYAPTSAI